MPSADDQRLQAAFSLHQKGNFNEAAKLYRALIKTNPTNFYALHFLGVIEAAVGNIDQAKHLMARSMSIQPPNVQFMENYATILILAGDSNSALKICQHGLQLNNANASLLYLSANSLFKLSRLQESIAQFDKLLSLQPNHIAALNERGSVLAELEQYDAALASVEKALVLNPQYAEAHVNKGNLYGKLKRPDEALSAYEKALVLKPDLANAWLGLGNVLNEIKRFDQAFGAYDKALMLKPDFAEPWFGRGNVFVNLKRYDEALAAYDKALALKPSLANAWSGRGYVFNKMKRHEEAANAYAEVLKINPGHPFTKGKLLHQKMLACDWKDVNASIASINEDVLLGKLSAHPFGWQGVARSERSLQLCAELFNERSFPAKSKIAASKPVPHKKIRIGYSSGELREQATSNLIVGLLELHDNSRFEIYGFDNGWDDQSEVRKRINASLHRIVDISRLSDTSAAAAISENEIDILVNLNGYFGEERTAVFANRCASIQVNYLGFPGTLGASYMDYIIADQHVIPEKHKEFYTEKIAYLPNCYQANDNKKKIGNYNFTRLELGLPENGFIFCCFNNNYKILPDVFDCWMRILKKVDGSVLWLFEDNPISATNLRKEAVARGISLDRLVFAKQTALSDHLARHHLADLFLDTLPYNAHTTASDALWAGLPILTCLGETFAGRVAASLLNAIRLPELITLTLEAYEQLAIDLATHPEKLLAIKRKLAENRLTTPLFDTKLFAEHIEVAYTMMYERHQAGLAPDHLIIPNG
jgi:protein O-GlcNAc transferase